MLLEMTAGYPAYAVVDASAGNVIEFCWLSAYAPAASFWKTVKITFSSIPYYENIVQIRIPFIYPIPDFEEEHH